MSRFERTIGLIGEDGAEKLKNARVLLFGVGGVGGYVAEALIRSGVGRLDAVDGDTVADSNINRQIVALTSTIGRYKAEVFSERAKDINPEAEVTAYNLFLTRIPRRSSIFGIRLRGGRRRRRSRENGDYRTRRCGGYARYFRYGRGEQTRSHAV